MSGGDRRISLLTGVKQLVSREIRRVHSVVIRRSAAEPDDHGVGREPVTPDIDQAEQSGA